MALASHPLHPHPQRDTLLLLPIHNNSVAAKATLTFPRENMVAPVTTFKTLVCKIVMKMVIEEV